LPNDKTAEVPFDKLCDVDKNFVKQETEKKENPFVIRERNKPTVVVPTLPPNNKSNINKDTPFETLKAEAEKSDPDALCWLAIAYSAGLNKCKVDKTKMSEYVERAAKFADTGSAAAQFCRGVCLFQGYNVNKNQKEAVKWFRKAAEQSFAPSQERLGMCLLRGIGIAENKTEGFELIRKAAEQDFAPAQFSLGYCYSAGDGIKEDEKESLKWYLKSAENGDASAQKYVGTVYLLGLAGTEKKLDEALIWFKKSAAQGDKEADEIVKRIEKIEKDNAKPATTKIDTENEKTQRNY
jgi:TPR repeat protein